MQEQPTELSVPKTASEPVPGSINEWVKGHLDRAPRAKVKTARGGTALQQTTGLHAIRAFLVRVVGKPRKDGSLSKRVYGESTADYIGAAPSSREAEARHLQACASKRDASPATVRKWRKRVEALKRAEGLVALLLLVLGFQAGAQQVAPPVGTQEKRFLANIGFGASAVGTLDETKPFFRARVVVKAQLDGKSELVGRGDLDREQALDDVGVTTPDQVIGSIETFATVEAGLAYLYRISPEFRVGAAAAVTWSRDSHIQSPRDPRLWTAIALGCYDLSDGGVACGGFGQRGPAGGLAGVVSIQTPIKGGFSTAIDFDIPVNKVQQVVLVGAGAGGGRPPTSAELAAAAHRLPLAVKVAAIYSFRSIRF